MSVAMQIVEAIGAKAVVVNSSEHDRALSFTSHIPFLLSSALALSTPKEAAPFLGPGYRSASRLAGTPASMMLGVIQTNHDNVLNALAVLQTQLKEIETILLSEDYNSLEELLNQAKNQYHELIVTSS